MIWNDTIRSRVMRAVEAKIKVAQEKYDLGVEALEKKLEEDKETLATNMVESVIGKLK